MKKNQAGHTRLRAKTVILIIILMAVFGCRPPITTKPPPEPPPDKPADLMGFAIQVGAFSMETNAQKLTQALLDKGYDAYAFVHESGLYKVRLGNFSTIKKAEKEAKTLLSQKLIQDFFIIRPEDYAAYRAKTEAAYSLRGAVVSTAGRFIGQPYCWGGTSPEEGFDCSGLTMAVYRLNGINLPRTSRKQFKAGRAVSKTDLKQGDLLFFATNGGRDVSHVGIYVGGGRFIHAPKTNTHVREDSLSNSYFKARFIGARTYF
jgi:cell wall-associated NlpC family hydrolase